jgi:hypothetical protein
MGFSPHTYTNPKTNRLERLFFAHPDAVELYKKHPEVVLLDCTYKTNRFRMPLLNMCAVTGNRKTIQVVLCFLSGEKTEDYDWAMGHFEDLMLNHEIPEPDTWVTDRELALMNTLDDLFPDSSHLLCTWHVNMNILANCRKFYPADLKDPLKKTLINPQGYVPDPKWTAFLKDWATLLDSPTIAEYTARLSRFSTHQKEAVAYVKSVWLVWKEKLVKYWVDQCRHFGIRVTSPIEGCHAVLKAYLRVSTGDLKGVFDKLVLYWPKQHRDILDTSAQEQNRVVHRLNKRYFDLIQGLVHDTALYLLIRERAKLHKAEDEATLVLPCQCTIKASMGLPCFHDLFHRLKDGGQVLPEDIHPFWWYDRAKVSTTLEKQKTSASVVVLDPVVVKGKGRPKGSKGNRKGAGSTGMIYLVKTTAITVLILQFSTTVGTGRELSLFEFSSTAPAVLASAQPISAPTPAVQTAVDNFMASLSTTQIGLQRTIGTEDTYIPGTVPERLYKRAAKAHELNESDGAFVLTPDVLAPTLEEVAAVQAEVDDDALTRAIEAVKSTVRLSGRLRVDSEKVRLNKTVE